MRKGRWIWASAGVLAAGVVFVGVYHNGQASAQGTNEIGSIPAATLPATDALTSVPGLTEIGQSVSPLWNGLSGTGPFDPSTIGFVGGISQAWVVTSAINAMGSLGHGLQLPLPASFVANQTGPLEVYDRVLEFNNTTGPTQLLNSTDYNQNWSGSPFTQVPSAAIDGGWAYTEPNPDNNGETQYLFQWAHGDYWNQVMVEGPSISAAQAAQVASHIGQ